MGLDPKFLDSLPNTLVDLYGQVEIDILADMARRISTYDYFIPAAQHQNQKLQELGMMQEEILKRLSALTGRTQAEIVALLTEAGEQAVADDLEYYKAADVYKPDKVDTEALHEQLNAGLVQTDGAFKNITRTTARTGAGQLIDALDRAWLQINTGAFDYSTAIRRAIIDVGEKGLGAVKYPSGRVDSVEVAVRRAIVTGANQTAAKTQEKLADQLEVELVEVTAHSGARPAHAKWQGQVFSRNGDKVIEGVKYKDLRKATRYGYADGLLGVNCRHSIHPYVPGTSRAWSDKELAKLEEKNIEYNGVKMTEYEASQKQRKIEREIRKQKRTIAALDAAGEDSSEYRSKLRKVNKLYSDFTEQTGLKQQRQRTQIAKPSANGQNTVDNSPRSGKISSIEIPIEQRNTGRGNPSAITHFDVELNKRQQKVLDELPEYDSRVTVPKKAASMKDLSALTAKTGVEFAMFTKGGERLIIRGDSGKVNIGAKEAAELRKAGYKWSGHTHPGTGVLVLQPSAGDYLILEQFGQESSVIYDSLGNHYVFFGG